MMPAARVQAAIELLDSIIEAAKREGAPADRLISAYFKQRRYAGSKDRRAVRDLVYRVIRYCGEIPKSGRVGMIALALDDPQLIPLFDGSTHGPPAIGKNEKPASPGVAPQWLTDALSQSGVEGDVAAGMLGRAPLDIRVNTLKAEREGLELPEPVEALEAPNALRIAAGTNVDQWDEYLDGKIEVQDHGSQIACIAAGARSGEMVIDLCAGAGGKTLSLAAAMGNAGHLIACDTDRGRLSRLVPRANRAGASMVQTRLLNPKEELEALEEYTGNADLVLVDAPCSGTGTWRRKPEGKWRLTPKSLAAYTRLQDDLLEIAAKLVKPGGRIAFVTCSLLDAEGADRIAEFLERNEGFSLKTPDVPLGIPHGGGVRLDPFHHGTDGFFVAIMQCA
ncbi:RsmB/NOP family class I SAM-dependent RNA methyltransferase [Erythrobacter crassostreae]|uniref:RsmB/NOP family class I SAM-dependent RNA methyltransferase n=1 Tax=Erythrobacter crassostreae TaxID=2828328 RepID=A0A9X1JLH3_9SPHN|nr:RsmB/NOP family class I SAM-dependent RNA methyltransferase [Erythrobacter crassostrea]MBV7260066.1 RsmB/NOP family class I SAM-dependent RNA methyltransferase [Erythrobacter crassostrea]